MQPAPIYITREDYNAMVTASRLFMATTWVNLDKNWGTHGVTVKFRTWKEQEQVKNLFEKVTGKGIKILN